LDDESLSKLVQKTPSAVGCKIDKSLEPTIKFHEEDCVGSKAAIIQCIEENLRVACSSLWSQLKRLVECQEAGISMAGQWHC
jgi:hypothetical protein